MDYLAVCLLFSLNGEIAEEEEKPVCFKGDAFAVFSLSTRMFSLHGLPRFFVAEACLSPLRFLADELVIPLSAVRLAFPGDEEVPLLFE